MKCLCPCSSKDKQKRKSNKNVTHKERSIITVHNDKFRYNPQAVESIPTGGVQFRNVKTAVSFPNLLADEAAHPISPRRRFSHKTGDEFQMFATKFLDLVPDKKKNKPHWDFKDKFKCLFCGGNNCKHEVHTNNKSRNAVEGLHSDFITDDIIASQRPSKDLIDTYDIVRTFKTMKIGLIVNLQREGEHPYCGPSKLQESGYTYDPHLFTAEDIKCRLSGWKDMAVPDSVNFMLNTVKEMCVTIQEEKKKVLVHCHAGYGRTGVVIACYLIYNSSNKGTDEIIEDMRVRRAGMVQKSEQKEFCQRFENYVRNSKILFEPAKNPIEEYLRRQKDFLFGEKAHTYENIPILIIKVIEKVLELRKKFNIPNLHIYKLMCRSSRNWDQGMEDLFNVIKSSINRGNWEFFNQVENLLLIIELLYDWVEISVENVINRNKIYKLINDEDFVTKIATCNDADYMHTPKAKGLRKKVSEQLKNELRGYEYEIIFKFAEFCSIIQPTNAHEEEEFLQVLDIFSAHLLGFKMKDLYVLQDKPEFDSLSIVVTGMSDIMRVFMVGIQHDDVSSFSPNRRASMNSLHPYTKGRSSSVNFAPGHFSHKFDSLNLLPRPSIESENSQTESYSSGKDDVLTAIYAKLQIHFKKGGEDSPKDEELIQSIMTMCKEERQKSKYRGHKDDIILEDEEEALAESFDAKKLKKLSMTQNAQIEVKDKNSFEEKRSTGKTITQRDGEAEHRSSQSYLSFRKSLSNRMSTFKISSVPIYISSDSTEEEHENETTIIDQIFYSPKKKKVLTENDII